MLRCAGGMSAAVAVVAPHLVDVVQAGEGEADPLLAVGQLVGLDAVDVRLRDDPPQHPRQPEEVGLRAELLVDRLGGGLAGRRVGVRLDVLNASSITGSLRRATFSASWPMGVAELLTNPNRIWSGSLTPIAAGARRLERSGQEQADVLALLDRA